ncbi:heme biosynthesis HemY N-terminal domain-containing protein [Rickettsiella endosymbiont of Dermanyssus gallinae]|uniref:heme biosynthesis HemY N-terminal domain-containing protein n=1 Tax=Rickettsiella endosymbiont of Dermanyssus gallinae TaxID=2856608 RepID=UPI001C5332C7|nr:heme biosynthesis HemY N-terminal domain-containing protein [Rickettsiella endosymbiont of Dermanyssus gallinae]
MKRFFIFLIILLFSVWIGVEIATDPGYVLITRHKLAIEMPLWLALIGFLLSFIVVYFLIRTIHYFGLLPKRWRAWLQNRQQQKQDSIEDQTLFATLYQKPPDWNIILNTLPQLEKRSWLSEEQIQKLEHDSYAGLLQEAIQTNLVKFEEKWQQLPHRLKKDPYFLNFYIQGLIQYHETEKAEELTRKLLKKHWSAPLVHTYGLIRSAHPERQLAYAEKWLKNNPHDPDLLLSLGRICKQLQLWGKARDYLETGLTQNPSNPESYQELGELFEALGEPSEALQAFKKALKIRVDVCISDGSNRHGERMQ